MGSITNSLIFFPDSRRLKRFIECLRWKYIFRKLINCLQCLTINKKYIRLPPFPNFCHDWRDPLPEQDLKNKVHLQKLLTLCFDLTISKSYQVIKYKIMYLLKLYVSRGTSFKIASNKSGMLWPWALTYFAPPEHIELMNYNTQWNL